MALWIREDFEFEKEEDFFKICYGFAKKVAQGAQRTQNRQECVEFDPETPGRISSVKGLEGAEMKTFLEEVMRIGKAELEEEEWELITLATNREGEAGPVPTKLRVRMYRIRKKLAKMTGWKEFEV